MGYVTFSSRRFYCWAPESVKIGLAIFTAYERFQTGKRYTRPSQSIEEVVQERSQNVDRSVADEWCDGILCAGFKSER